MLRGIDSGLQRISPGVGKESPLCPNCGEELQTVSSGRWSYFEHIGISCHEIHPTDEYLSLKGYFSTMWPTTDGPELDMAVGDRLGSMVLIAHNIVIEAPSLPITPETIRRITAAWNDLGWKPLWIFCQPPFGNLVHVEDDRYRLKARTSEALLLDTFQNKDFPYLLWDGESLFALEVMGAKERLYFGRMREFNRSRLNLTNADCSWGRVALFEES